MTQITRAEYVKTFNDLTVPSLRARAADAGIVGRSKMNKAELVGVLANFEVAQAEGRQAVGVEPQKCLLEHGYVKPCQQDRGHASECDKETVGLVRKTGDVPAELCDHGIKLGRKCSICVEDAAKDVTYAQWHTGLYHRAGECKLYGPDCRELQAIEADHAEALLMVTLTKATPLYVRITEGIEDQENALMVVNENETLSFGALGWSGGLPHIDLYRANGERVRFDLEYFKKVAVAVDHIDFQPQLGGLNDPALRRAFVQAGKPEVERLREERDAFKTKLMESFVYMTLVADKIEKSSIPRFALAGQIRQFVRDGHKL